MHLMKTKNGEMNMYNMEKQHKLGKLRVFDTLFAPWFSHSPTLQPFEAYFFVKF